MSTPAMFRPHFKRYPRHYVAKKLSEPLAIDGDLTKQEWQDVPWSEPFDDIRGPDAPDSERPGSGCRTRVKMLWDDNYLYIGARLESDFKISAEFTERNSPIFHKDSDFEVFVDTGSCNHWYKELEMNAINTVWNLMLDRPYADGGHEISGRVAKNDSDPNYWEVTDQKTAVKLLSGELNGGSGGVWTCEVALSHSDLQYRQPARALPPPPNHRYRINFSRVEKKGDINWVWSPQVVWDAAAGKWKGQVNMHLPDAWGEVVLADRSSTAVQPDPRWPFALGCMNIYYAQAEFRKREKRWAKSMTELRPLCDAELMEPFKVEITQDSKGYTATVTATGQQMRASIQQDRLLRFEEGYTDLETHSRSLTEQAKGIERALDK